MLADVKRQAREALHGVMAVPVSYIPPGGVAEDAIPTAEQTEAGLSLTARWHNRRVITGERSSDDVAILEGINRLVFNQPQLDELELTLERNGKVIFADYDKSFRLDGEEDTDGPLNVYWSVIELLP